ncbi:MAG: thioredoxin family protein [Bacteroidales bacterium]|jgi:thiol:disulfide interchange protein DsbD|nr:thioredoxin family protein [Bacteroidales bacterium]
MSKKIIFCIFFLISFVFTSFCQIENPVEWKYSTEKIDETHVNLIFQASIKEHWHLYSQYFKEGGPITLYFEFAKNDNFVLMDSVQEFPNPIVIFDETFKMEVKYFEKEAKFIQEIEIKSAEGFNISVKIDGQSCFDDGKCLQITEEHFFPINGGIVESQNAENKANNKTTPIIVTENNFSNLNVDEQSLLVFFLISILFGIIAILTPCVFPMIPMTISFFIQGSKSKSNSIIKALVFGFSIMILYTLVGVIVSLTSAGADFTTTLSTHWIPNLIFFLLFLVFASSLFGLFEFAIPTRLANKADQQVDRGGILSAFFLAVTLVIVSFACTGPIIGALLVQAASGNFLQPTIGMLGFGLGFAVPFTFLALVPKFMNKLPKSGGWMNSIKIVMGFVIIAFSLKFASNIDQNYHLNLLSRDIYIAIWIVLSFLLGLYLLGKIKFHLDSEVSNIGFFRLLLAVSCFVFSIYLIPGLFGANLSTIAGLLPPKTSQKFDLTENNSASKTENNLCETPKYADVMHTSYNVNAYFDCLQGINCAKSQNKPILLYFTGHSCSNCKVMQAEIWSDPNIQEYLNNELVLTVLYVDEKTVIVPEESQFISINDSKLKKNLGEINGDIEIVNFKNNTQPYYVLMSPEGKVLTQPMTFNSNPEDFMNFLKSGIEEFNK